jgi:hypothetical protein
MPRFFDDGGISRTMQDAIKKLLEKNFLNILESTPSACLVIVDRAGQWHIDDFDVVWFNSSAKKMFGNIISGGRVNVESNEQINEIIENLQLIRQQLLLGQDGFIGPFRSVIDNANGQSVHVDRYTLYLGEIGQSLPAFLVLAHGTLDE